MTKSQLIDAMVRLLNRGLGRMGFQARKSILNNRAWDCWDRLYDFELSANDREWQQLMMYSEIFSQIKDLPGDFIEFGVGTGISLLSFVRMNEIHQKNLIPFARRHIYGFDSFQGLPKLAPVDYPSSGFAKPEQMREGGYNGADAYHLLRKCFAGRKDVTLVKGWFHETLPQFFEKYPHLAFSLIHIDCDLFESTRTCLNYAFERIVPGGIVLFDELFHPHFPGETVGFWEVFNECKIASQFTAHRVASMPWKTYLVRKAEVNAAAAHERISAAQVQ